MVELKLASVYSCARGRARIYHLHNRKVYDGIGEPNTWLRKRGNVLKAIERLIVLDAVIAKPDLHWLATEREKVDHCIRRHALSLAANATTKLPGFYGNTRRLSLNSCSRD